MKLEKSADWKQSFCKYDVVNQCCKSHKYDIIYQVPELIKKDLYIMNNCMHNEFVGLRNRYLKETKHACTYDRKIVDQILDEFCTELNKFWEGPITLEQFMERKKGNLYTRYSNAVRKINDRGYDVKKHSSTSAFVKNELYSEIKPPRMIINRDTRFNLDYGRFTIPLEHCMMNIPQFSKGKNFIERGKQFGDLVYQEGTWFLEGDASKFEGTQRPELLDHIELGIWKRLLNSKEYQHILKIFEAKMIKRGITMNGVKFKFKGCRGSGDMDTGLFNSILMYIACRYFEIMNKFPWSGKFIVDGDDNVMKIPRIDTYIDTFAHFGFDAKLIIRKDYHDVDYCSGKFIKANDKQFMYVQNIVKIINNMSVFRKIKFDHCKSQYYHSLGYMYKVIYGDLPMFKQFSEFLLRSTKNNHVNKAILNELNPMYAEVFEAHKGMSTLEYSETIKVELAMSFEITTGYVDYVCEYYQNSFISFDKKECRRYNERGTKRNALDKVEIMKCETLLDG